MHIAKNRCDQGHRHQTAVFEDAYQVDEATAGGPTHKVSSPLVIGLQREATGNAAPESGRKHVKPLKPRRPMMGRWRCDLRTVKSE